MREIINFLNTYPIYWASFFILAPIGILIYKWRRLDISFRLLLFFLVGKCLLEVTMIVYATFGWNNIWQHNILLPFRYVMLSGVFYYFLESPVFRKWIRISIPFFIAFTCFDIYLSNNGTLVGESHLFVRYSGIVECLLMLLWILLYFYELLQSLKISNLLRSSRFLVAVAWLLYYASLVFFTPLFYYIYRSGAFLDVGALEMVPDFMEILAVVIVTIAAGFISLEGND